jgi:5-methylcytosine-specific restriction endonuclease McrA
MVTVAAMPGFRPTAGRPQAQKRPEALIHIFIRIKLNTLPAFGWDVPLPMKHPPSKTVGRKYWLAKATERKNEKSTCFLCPEPKTHLQNKDYSFTPADFDPTGLTKSEAIKAGKEKSVFEKWGTRFGSQIWSMAHEVSLGDVIFLETHSRNVHAWGIITRAYQYRPAKVLRAKELETAGLHSIGVEWHELTNGKDSFKAGRSDNLLFREITKKQDIVRTLVALTNGPPTFGSRRSGEDAPQDLEYREGGKVLQTHLRTERDAKAAKLAKELACKRSKTGDIVCETCGTVPKKEYAGLDLIEAHHRIPLARGVRETKPEDFAMLCPCCHRAVHKLINADVEPLTALKRLSKLFA